MLVIVEEFIYPADFIVLYFEKDKDIPIIFERSILATGRALIDVQKGKLTMRMEDKFICFKVFKEMSMPSME